MIHDENIGADDFRGLGPPLGPKANERRLDQFLAEQFPFNSRQVWKDICQRGHLLVNGSPARATRRLKCGDKLAVRHLLEQEPEVDDRISFIAEDAGILAVYKPAPLPMHESGYYRRNTFTALLHKEFGSEWSPVHRLDRETSGVVLCAATNELRRDLSQRFESRLVCKEYLAIMASELPWERMLVDKAIASSDADGISYVIISDAGVPAQTEFEVIERKSGATLVRARPLTGRTNQIRVHAAYIGAHLVGDKIYHRDSKVYDAYARYGQDARVGELAGFKRHALHAAKITLEHPSTGQDFIAHANFAEDLKEYWSNLPPIS